MTDTNNPLEQNQPDDLILVGGRVFDPAGALDIVADVAIRGDKIVSIKPGLERRGAGRIIDARGKLVVPGLVDLHTHVYWGGTGLGVDAETVCCRSGTTTFVDAGSAGAGNFPGFRRFIAEPSRVNVLAFLNVSYAGIFGFGCNLWVGECQDLRLLDRDECLNAVEKNRDLIVGIKVRLGAEAGGESGLKPLEIAREVADRLSLPIMTHVDMPPPKTTDALALMRPGDIWTHCFRGPPNSIIADSGEVEPEIIAAKRRGIRFDVGHGFGSFSFSVARRMIADRIYPDSISSDVHAFNFNGPARDVLHVASKFLSLGMPLSAVIEKISSAPASSVGRSDLGRLVEGGRADVAVLSHVAAPCEFVDSHGEVLLGEQQLTLDAVVANGRLLRDVIDVDHSNTPNILR